MKVVIFLTWIILALKIFFIPSCILQVRQPFIHFARIFLLKSIIILNLPKNYFLLFSAHEKSFWNCKIENNNLGTLYRISDINRKRDILQKAVTLALTLLPTRNVNMNNCKKPWIILKIKLLINDRRQK